MTAYYNEIDPEAAETLRELMKRGVIAPGDVDERSIEDVRPDDLRPYTQCHFFAGCGIWSYALRLAGWPDDRAVWTGSEPCQPHSTAGKRLGAADKRYLRPAWHHIIKHGKPAGVPVYGEQVANGGGIVWLDTLQNDMEEIDHEVWAFDLPAAGFGAPHIRQRFLWVANSRGTGLEIIGEQSARHKRQAVERGGTAGWLANAKLSSQERQREYSREILPEQKAARFNGDSSLGWLADANGGNAGAERQQCSGEQRLVTPDDGIALECPGPGAINGFWRDADWLLCRDGRWRPVESGTFPLASGSPARVLRLRLYGNGLNAEEAAWFIRASNPVRLS